MSRESAPMELDAERMRALLEDVDDGLRRRGVAASIYVVGGAAMTLAYGREGMTPDIDAIVSHRAVLEEAEDVSRRHGLPTTWLNTNASGWVPPRPAWARRRPTTLGLTVHVAPAEHLLAMKLIASRRKDRPDIRVLIEHCGMTVATPEDYAALLHRVYTGEGLLAQMLGVHDDPASVTQEALAIGLWARDFMATSRDRLP
ncbi:hypothetical protein GCM10027425_04770 [Alteromonas gracilis]